MILAAAMPAQAQVDWNAVVAHMGWFDVVTILMFLVGVVFGLRKGLAKVLQLIVVVMVAETVSIQYSQPAADFVYARIPIPFTGLHVVVFLFLALVFITIVYFSFAILSLIATVQFKPAMSRIGGFLLGGVLFILFLSLIAALLNLIPIPFIQAAFKEGSVTGGPLIELGVQIRDLLVRWIPGNWQVH